MKFKFLALASVAVLSSCSWTGRQADGMMDWANTNMPTFDGSRPGLAQNNGGGAARNNYNGYPYNSSAPRAPMAAPGVSGMNTPALPGMAPYSEKGMTPAQAASAMEGGNSRPMAYPANTFSNTNAAKMTPPPAFMSSAPAASASSNDRRPPSSQLPPSAIQPVPYGTLHEPSAGAARTDAKTDDFPIEYKKSAPGSDPSLDSMIPPPPI